MTAMTAVWPAVLQPRRLGTLFFIAICDISIWVLAGFFATSEFYRRTIVMGGPPPWQEVLDFQMVVALNWAAFTPLVVAIAQSLPLRPPHRMRNLIAVASFIPYLAVLRAAMGGAVLNLGEHDPISLDMITFSIGIRTHRYMAIMAVIFFVYNLVEAQREAGWRERQQVQAQTLLARAEIDELRTRLQPQFAVRMLRHIGSVIRSEPGAADEQIVALSAILRRSMARGMDERIRLADELDHFDRCLDLCRAGDRFSVEARYFASDDVLNCCVPAMLLQPAIEAVVLDLTTGTGGSVEVHCTREGAETRIEISWTVAPGGAAMKTALRIPLKEAAA